MYFLTAGIYYPLIVAEATWSLDNGNLFVEQNYNSAWFLKCLSRRNTNFGVLKELCCK